MRKRFIIAFAMFLVCGTSMAQKKTIEATRIAAAPKIDGNLTDEVWQSVPVASDFIQNFPNTGSPGTKKTDVKIAYDDNAIYVGAYLFDNPSLIRKQITARDDEQMKDADYFSVFLDTYNDDQNGFQFLVTSANVQTDARMGPNLQLGFGEYGDKTWQAVWESKTSIQKDGWVVEMRIPYLSLRFAKKDLQTWGVNFMRYMRRNNESDFWSPIDPKVSGIVNQFGDLTGLKGIRPPLRLSFSPYVNGGYRSSPQKDGYEQDILRSGGMDVKYGINESFTLDATLIPDFGQVISDNVVQNLTPYEVQFQENRPFFNEGTELFNKAGIFYSRRVGAQPGLYDAVKTFADTSANWEIIKNPSVTNLYNAVKFSGRNKKKFGIGIFNAITAPMDAKLHNKLTGADSVIRTEPLANYNILVLDQALKGQSYLTFTNTNVIRNGSRSDANVSSFDFAFFDKKNVYGLTGSAKYSKIFNSQPYDGYNSFLRFARVSGNWQYNARAEIISDKYNSNDLGYLLTPNTVTYRGGLTYRRFTPTNTFVTYSYGLTAIGNYLYRPYSYGRTDLALTGFVVFKNFWDVTLETVMNPGPWKDFFELRRPGQYYMQYPFNISVNLYGSTDSRKKAFVNYVLAYGRTSRVKIWSILGQLGLRYRFSDRFTLSVSGDLNTSRDNLGNGFITSASGAPVAAKRDIDQFTSLLSGIYNFTPRLNLTIRARHYWLKLNAKQFYDVAVDGTLTPNNSYFTTPVILFNQNYFNVDAFLTWDFRLGSRLIFGWKNWLGDEEMVDGNTYKKYFGNLGQVINMRHGNELTLRFIYFLDYNQLRKKK